MTPTPRWVSDDYGPYQLIEVTVDGDLDVTAVRQVATAMFIWARRRGIEVPDLSCVCRYGKSIFLRFPDCIPEWDMAIAGEELPALAAGRGDSTLLADAAVSVARVGASICSGPWID